MDIIYQLVVMACLLILSACAVIFPILFLIQFKKLRNELIDTINNHEDSM